MSRVHLSGVCLIILIVACSCGSYRQNIMFKPAQSDLATAPGAVPANYTIQKNDLLTIKVYTNLGEIIIDPGPEPAAQAAQQDVQGAREALYLVDAEGVIKFPLISSFRAEGLTLRGAESLLEKEYAKFYQQPFVKLNFSNKRVVVLGAPEGKVIPLTNENMKLTEILALSGGADNEAIVKNIRILRGSDVLVADLSTIDGYRKYNYTMQPGDIVYIEPIRRPFVEAFRDYGPFLATITSLTTLIVVTIGLK